MASNLNRIYPLFKNNENLSKLITSIDKKYPQYTLGANTPLPNQALETARTAYNRPTCLYLKPIAVKNLNWIRDIAQKRFVYRQNHGKEDKPIEFVCQGYMDFSGDIVITHVDVTTFDLLSENEKDPNKVIDTIIKGNPSKDITTDTLAKYYDYLRNPNEYVNNHMGVCPVAFYGTTRPIVEYADNTNNCIRFNELAKAIVPGDVEFKTPIISGVMSISPKFAVQSSNGCYLKDGSLECIMIDYIANKNNTMRPHGLYNIVHCQKELDNDKLEIVDISKSHQDLNNLPCLEELTQKRT